jgi:terminal uridylyltransferase
MVLYYLVHVKQPPVLPNLQRIAPLTALTEDQIMLDGRNIYFFDDVEILRREWSSINFETVGELYVVVTCHLTLVDLRLIDFFRFFSHDFQFNNQVLSLRAGPLTKESKGWVNDVGITWSTPGAAS